MSVRRGPPPGGPPVSVASAVPSEGFSLLFSRESLLGVGKPKENDVLTPPLHLLHSKAKSIDARAKGETINVSIRHGKGGILDPSVYFAVKAVNGAFNTEMAVFFITVTGTLNDVDGRPVMAAAIKNKILELFGREVNNPVDMANLVRVMPYEEVNSCNPNNSRSTWVFFTDTPEQTNRMVILMQQFRGSPAKEANILKNICDRAFGNVENLVEFMIGTPPTAEQWQRRVVAPAADAESQLVAQGTLIKLTFTFRNISPQDSDALSAGDGGLSSKAAGKRRKV